MTEMLFVPLHSTLGPSFFFYITFLTLTLPMFAAMSGLFLLKRTKLDTIFTGSTWWLCPVLYIGFPVGLLYTTGYSTVFYLVATFLLPPVLGFLQAAFLDPEKNAIYLLAFVVGLFPVWGVVVKTLLPLPRMPEFALLLIFLPLAVYLLSLVYVITRVEDVRRNYDRLFIPVFFLTIISLQTLFFSLVIVFDTSIL